MTDRENSSPQPQRQPRDSGGITDEAAGRNDNFSEEYIESIVDKVKKEQSSMFELQNEDSLLVGEYNKLYPEITQDSGEGKYDGGDDPEYEETFSTLLSAKRYNVEEESSSNDERKRQMNIIGVMERTIKRKRGKKITPVLRK